MMHEISGADREPRISGGGLHENLFEWRLIKNFPIGNAIERDPAGQANGLLPGSGVQRAKHFEQDLFQARLQRGRAVTMHFFDRSRGIARGPQAFGHIVGEHRAELGSLVGIAPGHLGPVRWCLKYFEAQAETDASVGANDVAEFIQISRLAVSGQAHDFVFIAEFAKSQVLRHGRVIHAERVGKRNRPRRCACDCPGPFPTWCWRNRRAHPRTAARPVRTEKRKTCSPGAPGDARCGDTWLEFFRARHQTPARALLEFPQTGPSLLLFRAAKLGILKAYRSFVPEARPGIARDRDVVDFTSVMPAASRQ